MTNDKVTAKITFVVLTVSVIITAITIGFGLYLTRGSLVDNTYEYLSVCAKIAKEYVEYDNWVKKNFANEIVGGLMDVAEDEISQYLSLYTEKMMHEGIAIVFKDETEPIQLGTELPKNFVSMKEAQFAFRGKQLITSPEITANNGVVFRLCTPVDSNRILVVTIPYSHFENMFSDLKVFKTGNVFIIDGDGVFVYNFRKLLVENRVNMIENWKDKREFEGISIAGTAMVKGEAGFNNYRYENSKRIMYHMPIDTDEKWSIGVAAPINETSLGKVNNSFGLVALISLFFGIFCSFFVLKPVMELVETNSRLSVTDVLTGVANRRKFDERMQIELKRAIRDVRPLALLMIDVDKFKEYNDSFGHSFGDACLKTLANVFELSIRQQLDLAARIGGDEFAILLPGIEIGGAMEVAKRILMRVSETIIPYKDGRCLKTSVSIGAVSMVPTVNNTVKEFCELADKRLYESKENGRNKVSGNT